MDLRRRTRPSFIDLIRILLLYLLPKLGCYDLGMISEDDRLKLRFDLANRNLQSVSRAQGIYLTSLLIYEGLVWIMFSTQPLTGVPFHFGWLELQAADVWKVTPVAMLILTLAIVGTLNAALIAYRELQEAGQKLFGEQFATMFEVDNHKNLVDYIALIQVLPWQATRKPRDTSGDVSFKRRLHNLIFPVLFMFSLLTSYWAIHEMYESPAPTLLLVVGWICFLLQAIFSVRPLYRWITRLFGASAESNVYN
jgi:hypothetical protein